VQSSEVSKIVIPEVAKRKYATRTTNINERTDKLFEIYPTGAENSFSVFISASQPIKENDVAKRRTLEQGIHGCESLPPSPRCFCG